MNKSTFKWLIIAATVTVSVSGWAQESDPGKTEFLSSCAPCHGADGKGNGPLSAVLKKAPPDLTVLAKKNNGVLPVATVDEIIDGRKSVAAHGSREMPVWGERFKRPFIYFSPALVEASVHTRILALVDYLNRIQEK